MKCNFVLPCLVTKILTLLLHCFNLLHISLHSKSHKPEEVFIRLSAAYNEGSVYMVAGKATFKAGKMDKSAAAYGFYNNTLSGTGWGVLEIKAGYGGLEKNNDLLYAAGYLEGALTATYVPSAWLQFLDPFLQYIPLIYCDRGSCFWFHYGPFPLCTWRSYFD
jgi:hypothetical protein